MVATNSIPTFAPNLVLNTSTQSVGPGSVATFLGYKLGVFHHFNMGTFIASDLGTGSEALNTFAPTAGALNFTNIIAADVAAGAKYAVLTVKHIDGFCLWPSAQTSRTIAGTTWYAGAGNQNIALAFVTACHAAGLKAGFYFNIDDLNWIAAHSGYTAAAFTAFVNAQLAELMAYAPDIVWFDQWQITGYSTVTFATVLAAIRAALPSCLVIVGNTGNFSSGVSSVLQFDTLHGDVVGWEVDAGGLPPANNVMPGEACETATVSGNWFWHTPGPSYKTAAAIAADQITVNGRNSNFLINFPLNQAGALDAAAISVMAGLPAALAAATPVPTALAVPSKTLLANQLLRGPVSGAAQLAVAGYLVDADFQVPGCHVPLLNVNNPFSSPQTIFTQSSDNIGATLSLLKRGQIGNSQGSVLNTSFLAQIGAQGWDGGAYGIGPTLSFYATENWGPTAHGSQLQIALIKTGTTTQSIHTFDNDGTIYFAGGAIFFNDGTAQFNNGLTCQRAGAGANPVIKTTDGTVTMKIQVNTGALTGFMGTESNHAAAILTNNTARINISSGGNLGFFGATAVAKPTVTGAKGSNVALGSLLTALVSLGLVTDSTSA